MALLFENVGDGLTRNGNFLNPAADSTVCLWVFMVKPDPVVGGDYVYWNLGNNAPSDDAPGAALFSDNNGNTQPFLPYAYVQPAAGPGVSTDYGFLVPYGAWWHIAYRYKASTTQLSNVVSGRVCAGPLTVTLTGVGVQTVEYLGTDTTSLAGVGVAYARSWQAWLTETELRREMRSTIAIRTANLLADTPLSNSLSDISGHGHDWTELAAHSTIRGPLTAVAGLPAGRVYAVYDATRPTVMQFNAATGALLDPAYWQAEFDNETVNGLTVDPSGRLYIAHRQAAP